MKRLHSLCIGCLLIILLPNSGFNQALFHQTISSGGGVLQNSSATIAVAAGQSIIGVSESVNLKVTQGFNQPDCNLDLDIGPIPKVCENSTPIQLYASIPGGVFFGPGIIGNTLHPELAGPGTHQIVYRINLNGCQDSVFASFTLKPKPNVQFVLSDTVCKSGIFLLNQGLPSGGVYAGLGVQPSGQNFVFRPNLAGNGTHLINYTYTDTNGCSASDTGFYSVINNPKVTFNLTNNLICPGTDSILLSGGQPNGGFYTGNGVNTTKSVFYSDSVGSGFHLVSYNYLDTITNCSGVAYGTLIKDTLPNNLGITISSDYCGNQSAQPLNAATPVGGTYFGLSQGLTSSGTLIPSLIMPNTYQIGYSYTSNFGCRDTVSDFLTIHPVLKPTLVNIVNICTNDSMFQLTSGLPQGGVYSGQAIANNTLNPAGISAGNYSYFYIYTDSNNCTAADTANITVVSPNQTNLTLPNSVCENDQPINLNLNYQGLNAQFTGLGVQGNSFNPALVNTSVFSKIFANGTDTNGCAINDSAIISIVASTPTSLNLGMVCSNAQKVKLNGGSPLGGVYSGNFVDSLGFFYPAQAQNATSIIYSFTNLSGCTTSDTFLLQLHQVQQPIINHIPAICKNDSALRLTANIPHGVFTGAGVIQGYFNPRLTNQPEVYYYYTITDSNNCTVSDTSRIAVIQPPEIHQNLKRTICSGSKVEYELPDEHMYYWSDGHLGANYQFTPNVSTNYSVTVTDGFCATADTFEIRVISPPQISSTFQAPNCEKNDGKIFTTVSGSNGPYDFQWSSGHFGTTVASNLVAGIYELTVTDVQGCQTIETFGLSNVSTETTISSSIKQIDCNNQNNGSISISLSNQNDVQYQWLRGDTGLTIDNLGAGAYFFTAMDVNGCKTVEKFILNNPNSLAIQPQIIPSSCAGNLGEISLVTSGGNGNYFYAWNSLETTSAIQNKPAGIYTVTVTDGNNCTLTRDFLLPNLERFYVSIDTIVSPECGINNGQIQLKTLGHNYSFIWNTADTTKDLQNLSQGMYIATINDGSCNAEFPIALNNLKPLQPEVCKVSIDSISGRAEIAWEGNGLKHSLFRKGIQSNSHQLIFTDTSNSRIVFTDSLYANAKLPLTYKLVSENRCGDVSSDANYISSIFLSAIRVQQDEVRLNWTQNTQKQSSINQYVLYGKQSNGAFNFISNVLPPQNSYSLDSLGNYTAFIVAAEVNFCGSIDTMYSNVASEINVDPNLFMVKHFQQNELQVFPNPTRTATQLLFNTSPITPINISLIGNSGQIVRQLTIQPIVGQNNYNLPLNNLAVGAYTLIVSYNNKTENTKLLVN